MASERTSAINVSVPDWAPAMGAVIVLALFGWLALMIAATSYTPSAFWDSAAPAWVQAIGSIFAIAATGLAAVHTVQAENRRRAREGLEARHQLQLGVEQMVGGVFRIAERVVVEASPGMQRMPTLAACIRQLDGLHRALGKVDHLRFDSHTMIEAVLVAEAVAASLYDRMNYVTKVHMLPVMQLAPQGWLDLAADATTACIEVRRVLDKVHASVEALAAQKQHG